MAVQNLLVAAAAEGLGTYIRTGGLMELPALRELVQAPPDYRVVAVVSVGWPAGEEPPRRRTEAALKTIWLG
jgi:nitroreductase